MKYIIYQNGFDQNKVALWSDVDLSHVARMDDINKEDPFEDANEVMGAGELSKNENNEIKCYGGSTTLKVRSRHEIDEAIIEEALFDAVLSNNCRGRCDEKN